jgi:polar amino acid transport system permease protein
VEFWDWETFFRYLRSSYLLAGAWTTIWLSFASVAIAFAIGLVVALMGMSDRSIISGPAKFYVWIWRGTPLLVQLLIIYTGLPQVGVRIGPIVAALIGLSFNTAAYLSEVIRGGILAVGEGQYLAARALGMDYWTMMRVVVLPQAARVIVPSLGNQINGQLKQTSLTSVVAMAELLRRSRMLITRTFAVLEISAVALIYYLVMTTAWGQVQNRIEASFGRAFRGATNTRGI